jgi:IS5 family transposase
MEDAIHDSFSFQSFLGLNPSTNSVPDETTILNFRHFLEEHKLQEKLFNEINAELIRQGYLLERASIVDATLIKGFIWEMSEFRGKDLIFRDEIKWKF